MTTKKYPQSSYPKNINFSENPPKKIEIQDFEPPKWSETTYCMKILENPLGDELPFISVAF